MLLQPIFIFSVPTPHELAPAASEYLGSSRNSLSNIYSRKLIFLINSSYEPLKNYEQLKMENFHSNKCKKNDLSRCKEQLLYKGKIPFKKVVKYRI